MNQNKDNNLEQEVMGQIKSGRVKLRSKYIFLAKKLGLESAWVLSAILAVLFFSLLFFYFKSTDNLYYLSFGLGGVEAFLESFPFLLIVIFLVLICLVGYLISQNNWSYKWPFKYVAVTVLIFVVVAGSVIGFSGVNQTLEEKVFQDQRMQFLKPLFNPMHQARDRGLMGVVSQVGENYLIIQSPHGSEFINLQDCPKLQNIQPGMMVVATGHRQEDEFKVQNIKVLSKSEIDYFKQRVERQFRDENGLMKNGLPENLLLPEQKECLKECRLQNVHPKQCFFDCVQKQK